MHEICERPIGVGVSVPTVTAGAFSSCFHPHLSANSPRRLCVVRRSPLSRNDATAILDVHVASCVGVPDDLKTPALMSVRGELTAASIDEEVSSALLEFALFARSVVLDLAGVQRIDDVGADLVDALRRVLGDIDGELFVHGPPPAVEQVLRGGGIGDRLRICHDR